ncbi:hypothetical protein CAL12_14955 [Bordetella genomosp. 8]|uniref:Uncharacterized protein n=1 Tax=Bordetella genomosp. 8 TaxID=1416806 RepID=A0A1W6YN58_9BORD|nr:hypothetical protein [Bordetella genomosp. 8]ARP81983.1 hypothetical protein CAL12_14955 [Bordetella genomosp. 8]
MSALMQFLARRLAAGIFLFGLGAGVLVGAGATTLASMSVQFTISTQCNVRSAAEFSAAATPSVSCLHGEPANVLLVDDAPVIAAADTGSESGPAPAIPNARRQFWVVTF